MRPTTQRLQLSVQSLQEICGLVENLPVQVLEFRPLLAVVGEGPDCVDDRGMVTMQYSPDLSVGVPVLGVGDVRKDCPCDDEFTLPASCSDVVGVDSDDLCRIAEDGASD